VEGRAINPTDDSPISDNDVVPCPIAEGRAINPTDDSPISDNDVVLVSLRHGESWGEYIKLAGALSVSGRSCVNTVYSMFHEH